MSFLITSLFMACGTPPANNAAANKPANAAANTATAPVADAAAIETELKKDLTDISGAMVKGDTATLDKLYADNYMLVNTDGSVQNKADRLASFKSGETKFESFTYSEVTVRSNTEGTGAVVVAKAEAKGMNKGKPVQSPIRVTQVWSKTKDGWRMVSGQATPITAAAPAKADDKKPAPANAANAPAPAGKPMPGAPAPANK